MVTKKSPMQEKAGCNTMQKFKLGLSVAAKKPLECLELEWAKLFFFRLELSQVILIKLKPWEGPIVLTFHACWALSGCLIIVELSAQFPRWGQLARASVIIRARALNAEPELYPAALATVPALSCLALTFVAAKILFSEEFENFGKEKLFLEIEKLLLKVFAARRRKMS